MFRILIILSVLMNSVSSFSQKTRVLLITGGHKFNKETFYGAFEKMPSIVFDTLKHPGANSIFESPEIEKYDVLVFYDMWQTISDDQQKAFLSLLEEGKGMVFLHHSLVSYQKWDEFTKIRGGKYYENKDEKSSKNSGYQHDIWLDIEVLDKNHPVTEGIDNFSIFDEGYYNIERLPDVHPILGTEHEKCAPYVAWTNQYKSSRIVYIMLGHGPEAHENKNFQRLVENAVNWVKEE